METSQNYISEKVRNADNTIINPATSEDIVLLRRIVKLLESNAVVDVANRQKVAVETFGVNTTQGIMMGGASSGAGVPSPNTPTANAPTVNAFSTYWQPVFVGPVDQRFLIMDQARNTYANSIRTNLIFS